MQAVDGGAVCVALANQHRYCMVNIQTGQVQIVFTPFIHSVQYKGKRNIYNFIAPFLEHTNLVPRVHVTLVQWNRQ